MAGMVAAVRGYFSEQQKFRLYGIISFLLVSAVAGSWAIISFYNNAILEQAVGNVTGRFQIALVTLMPYMISAIIAAITTIAIMTILPVTRSIEPGRTKWRTETWPPSSESAAITIFANWLPR
jgi:hypothetical protein